MAKKIKILVTGGAGYIGSHVCKNLKVSNFYPVSYDNLSTGKKDFVKWGPLIIGDILDQQKLEKVIKQHKVKAVIHLAAKSQVEESEKKFKNYFNNNVIGTACLLEAMRKNDVNKIIFSSTASVYGNISKGSIKENDSLSPINNYGLTKLYCENLINHFALNDSLNFIILRYFNAAGSDYDSGIGELRDPETHLIPRISEQILKKKTISVFGNQYKTKDGTCIRDFIHVNDIASAHVFSLRRILSKDMNKTYNVGTGIGYSVSEIIKIFKKLSEINIKVKIAKKRSKDPEKLIANPTLFKNHFNWKPKSSDIKNIINSEIYWRKMNI
tara:strand:- start:663 stop:1643 length:981 start_codon:yes stop_codon:yes gene_type:complete